MKNLRNVFAATLFIVGSICAQAQSKVAHINTQELVESMPEMMNAKSELEKLAKTYETDIQAMATELENKRKQYDAEASTKTDEENRKRAIEYQSMEQSVYIVGLEQVCGFRSQRRLHRTVCAVQSQKRYRP